MAQANQYFLITDVGSTTTKAILIENDVANPRILGIKHAETTVEEPFNDVCIGVHEVIKQLQEQVGILLLAANSSASMLNFAPNIRYLTTSSAGGGLQILVVGLTLFDSASSARRAAFGAGGILLDVFAIDDKRTAAEQMQAMRNLHPDMILLCGGTDGGAISGVLRLAEILRIAKPLPKFVTDVKIPTIYAGNQDVAEMVKDMISEDFNLVVLPNLRPTIGLENLKPTQDMIQKLFMENVMERAPGYAELKKHVFSEILPTPMGVLKSLINATANDKRNFFAFDIGGATTDVFSYIKGHYQRTVSANLGMSYSALNVLAESGAEEFAKELPADFSVDEVRNYIGNKTLYPTYNPTNAREAKIEQVMAKQAIRLALVQHQEMHYNEQKIGFLDKLKSSELDAYERQFEYELIEAKMHFYPMEIDVLIGAGGVFSHAKSPEHCAAILIDGFNAHGITELWLDKNFITPHLGVLSVPEAELSSQLLESDCLQKLGIHIRPHFPGKFNKPVLKVKYKENGTEKELMVMPDTVMYLDKAVQRELQITPLGKCVISISKEPVSLSTSLPIIIDTRRAENGSGKILEKALGIPQTAEENNPAKVFINNAQPYQGEFYKVVSLPYKGDILVSESEMVNPDTIVAINKFNPPRLFIVNPYLNLDVVNSDLVRSTLQVAVGDKVDFDAILRHLPELPSKRWVGQDFRSPVSGKVEFIDYHSGVLVLSEVQDYSGNPVKVKVAEHLGCPPKKMMSYLKHQMGDFVYQGDILAKKMESGKGEIPHFVKAPSSGVVTEIDRIGGTVTIQFKIQPKNYMAHVKGKVSEVKDSSSVTVKYTGNRLDAKLGLGKRCHGEFVYIPNPETMDSKDLVGKIVALDFEPKAETFVKLQKIGASAVICPGMKQTDLVHYLGKELGVINTGNEELPLCIIITDSFGTQNFSQIFKTTFLKYQGSLCHIEPHTRIRAGVARPYLCFM